MYVDPNKTAEELTPEEETHLIREALKKINKSQSLKYYRGKPFDPKDSLGDDLMEYQYYLMGKK